MRGIETVTSDLSLEVVLRRIVQAGCELADAEYGALGVIGRDRRLDQFIQVGVDTETADRIGHLPDGKGLLGALIDDPRPIRLRHMADDNRSAGFPFGHPGMDSFLGVPIPMRDEIYGNLYLTNSRRGEFSSDDEELVRALAVAAGAAISNARLYQEAGARQRWLEASSDVQEQILSPAGEDPLATVAHRSIELIDADLVTIGLLTPAGDEYVIEFAVGEHAGELIGRRFTLPGTVGERVILGGERYVATSAQDPEAPNSHVATVLDVGPLVALPLRGHESTRGLLTVARRRGRRTFSDADIEMVASFASHASVALELSEVRAAEQRMIMLEDRDRIAATFMIMSSRSCSRSG